MNDQNKVYLIDDSNHLAPAVDIHHDTRHLSHQHLSDLLSPQYNHDWPARDVSDDLSQLSSQPSCMVDTRVQLGTGDHGQCHHVAPVSLCPALTTVVTHSHLVTRFSEPVCHHEAGCSNNVLCSLHCICQIQDYPAQILTGSPIISLPSLQIFR